MNFRQHCPLLVLSISFLGTVVALAQVSHWRRYGCVLASASPVLMKSDVAG